MIQILDYFKDNSYISAVGICQFNDLIKVMTSEQIDKANNLMPDIKSIIFALFPYYNGQSDGNISLYARGSDYHDVVSQSLNSICLKIAEQYKNSNFKVLCDASPIPEVYGAYLSGCGILGDNGLIIDKNYGSYVFIGTVITDLALNSTYENKKTCIHCMKCQKLCPNKAINNGKIDESKCLSAITQKGGNLTEEETLLIKKSSLIWGCDICSNICPMNKDIQFTKNPKFKQDLINTLCVKDINGLTRRAFNEKYPNRAFTFRGIAPLLRNLDIQNK